MFFYMPTKVYAQSNCVEQHAKELAALGKRALLVTGRSSAKKNGSLGDVIQALENNGCSYVHFSEVEENPSTQTIVKAAAFGIDAGVDFVIGIGGGSPMDAAKAIALLIKNPEKTQEYLFDAKEETTALPLALIPTTCGTGSETTPYSIITRHELKTKTSLPHKVFAALALIDGKYLQTAPLHVLADTTTDALAHFAESFINKKATDYSRLCVLQGLSIWKKAKDIVAGTEQADEADYLNMLNASAMAGMAISHTGTSLPHGFSYALTYELGMPHGKACGYFLPAYIKEAAKEDRQEVLRMAGFSDMDAMETYYDTVCGREAVEKDLLERAVEGMLSNPAKLEQPPFPVDEALLRRVAGI